MIKDRSTFRLFIILIILTTFSLVRMTYFDWLLSPRKFLLNSWHWLNLLDASNMPWIQWYTATNIQLQPPFPGGGAQELLFLTRANSTKWSRWGIGLGDTYTITFWGIFELVVKESGGERSDGKKEKASLPARALLSFPSSPALLACSVVSVGKLVEEAASWGPLISAYISEHATGATPEECESSNAPSPRERIAWPSPSGCEGD